MGVFSTGTFFQRERQNRGFTLIELLLTIAILGMIVGSVTLLTQVTFDLRAQGRAQFVVQTNIRFSLGRIHDLMEEAGDVTLPGSGSGATLRLTFDDSSRNPTQVTLVGGAVMMTEGASASLPLTSSEVEITDLTFTRLAGSPAVVRISITGRMRNAVGPYQTVLTLTDTAGIRR